MKYDTGKPLSLKQNTYDKNGGLAIRFPSAVSGPFPPFTAKFSSSDIKSDSLEERLKRDDVKVLNLSNSWVS